MRTVRGSGNLEKYRQSCSLKYFSLTHNALVLTPSNYITFTPFIFPHIVQTYLTLMANNKRKNITQISYEKEKRLKNKDDTRIGQNYARS